MLTNLFFPTVLVVATLAMSADDGAAEAMRTAGGEAVSRSQQHGVGDGLGGFSTCIPRTSHSDGPADQMREVQESTIVCYALCDTRADINARDDAYAAWLSCRRRGGSRRQCNGVYGHTYWNMYYDYFNACMMDCTEGPYD